MTFDQLMAQTLKVFPNAILTESEGSILIEPGFYEVPGKSELGEYNPGEVI